MKLTGYIPVKPLLFLLTFTCTTINTSLAQKQEQYSRAKIHLDTNGHTMRVLAELGLALDHGDYGKDTYFISDFSKTEILRVRNAGFKVDIVIADVAKYYRDQNKKKGQKTTAVTCDNPVTAVPSHFHLGSYGGFFAYNEMLNILDSMQLLYPGLISLRQPIDTFHSIEGRPIYWIRVSNNPSVDQPAKPQMLYTALHHAREPGSLSATIYYLWYLLENYSTDPHIKTIIDNTELYFIPCVNPDGYIYNITSSPGGGGMWRKNRRYNSDGSYGVDLNRNYGYMWGYDNIGSSPTMNTDTYRGATAFSEPETQALKWFANNHHFRFALNYHSYNNNILYPWGYIANLQTVDSALFSNYGAFLTRENHYRYGTCNQTLNYITNGDSNDWYYGDTTSRPKVFSFTPEVGSVDDGFYPPATQIIPDCQNNLLPNINTASLLLPFANIQHTDKKILISQSGYLHYNLQRLGFPDTATFTVNIVPLDGWLTASSAPKVYTGLAILQQVNDSFSYSLLPSTPNGQLVSYVLQAYNGFYYIRDTVSFYYGKYYSQATPSSSSLADWVNFGWGVSTTSFYSTPASIQSSLTGSDYYLNNDMISISTASPVDLTHSVRAYLHFYTRWAIETNRDHVTVNGAVTGSGISNPLCGRYTRPKPMGGFPVYDGHQPTWVHEEIDLSDYLGQMLNIEFMLESSTFGVEKGYYFDDISITTVQDSPVSVTPLHTNDAKLVTYPNPAADKLTISVTGHSFAQQLYAALYDCLGREVKNFVITEPMTNIDVRHLPANIYYLKVFDNGKMLPVHKVNITR